MHGMPTLARLDRAERAQRSRANDRLACLRQAVLGCVAGRRVPRRLPGDRPTSRRLPTSLQA